MAGYPDYQLGFIRDRETIAILGGIWHDQLFEMEEARRRVIDPERPKDGAQS